MPKLSSQNFLKSQLRKDIRQKRTAIGAAQRDSWDTLINRNLEAFTRQHEPRVVAAFMAFDGEPDLSPALAGLARQGIRLALPVIQGSPGSRSITMREFAPDEEMQSNHYGIAEPVGAADIPLTDIDLVLIPLVAWDSAGNRLGMGAGYYDRLFQPFIDMERPVRLGVGYDLQQIEHLPFDPWDIHLHGILTEKGWITCSSETQIDAPLVRQKNGVTK
jgi:5-formyltetrahydrofolate cyclo-ligase